MWVVFQITEINVNGFLFPMNEKKFKSSKVVEVRTTAFLIPFSENVQCQIS